jgi:hypothetical protein
MPKSPLPPGSSNHPPGKIKLDETLSTVASQQYQERGRRTLSDEMPMITDDEVAEFEAKQVADVVDLHKSEPELEEGDRPSLSDPEAAQDLQEGVGVFREAVDTITSSLLLVIGKSEEGLDRSDQLAGKIAKNNRVSRLNSVIALLLVVGVAITLYRVNDVVEQGRADLVNRKMVTAELAKVRDELRGLKVVTDDTKKAVAKAEDEAAKKPTVEIVPDDKGGAKVVIRAAKGKKAKGGPKPTSRPKPKGDQPKPPAPPPAIEIPIKLPPGSKSAPQSPVPPK